MSVKDRFVCLMEETRGLSSGEFVRMLEGGRPMRASGLVSIKDLAAELGLSVRTLRRWNNLPDAPKRYRRGRRLMYRRVDVQHWHPQGATRAGDDAPGDGSV